MNVAFEAQYRMAVKGKWTFGGHFDTLEEAKDRCRRWYSAGAQAIRVLDHTPAVAFEFTRKE